MSLHNLPTETHHIKAYNDMPMWKQLIITRTWIRQYALPAIPALAGFSVGGMTASLIPFLLGLVGTGAYLATYLEQIKPLPNKEGGEAPQFGLLEVVGSRLPIVLDEGLALGMPFSRIVRRSKESFNQDVVVAGVRCRLERTERKDSNGMVIPYEFLWQSLQLCLSSPSGADVNSGGSLRFTVGLTLDRDWKDGWNVIDYDNAGETPQVVKIITDRISDSLREVGRRLTWLQATFATDLISVYVITALTGDRSFGGVRDILRDGTHEQIQDFLNDVKLNGRSYVGGLGIKVRRLQVTSVMPEGNLATEAEKGALELLRRVAMVENGKAIAEVFDTLRKKMVDGTMTDREVMTTVLVNDPDARVKHDIQTKNINIPDADKIVAALGRLMKDLGLGK